MQTQPKKTFDGMVKNQKKRKRWQQVVSTLVCIVVFCTTYALILPAITISAEVTCGLEAHTHDSSCYEQITAYELVCDPGHSHYDACYDENEELICGLSGWLLHTHGDACYSSDGTLRCRLEEREAHLHTDACYSTESGAEPAQICGQQELLVHTHTQDCFDGEGKQICGQLQVHSHTHDSECVKTVVTQGALLCGLGEHEHTEKCYENFPTDVQSALLFLSSGSDVATISSTSIFDVDDNVVIEYSAVEYNPETDAFDLSLELTFGLTGEELGKFQAFHIKLPAGMTLPDSLLGVKRSATDSIKDGMVAFDYWFVFINGEYVIHLEYREDYMEKIADLETTQNYIKFNGSISKEHFKNDGSLEVKWEDGTITSIPAGAIDYPGGETVNYDIHTQKSVVYNSAAGELVYTVKISSDKGTPSPINVADVLYRNNLPVNSLTDVSVKDQAGNNVSNTSTPDVINGK